MKHVLLLVALLVLLAGRLSGPADAAGFNQYVGFGDSTLDSGYFRYNTTGSATQDAQVAAAVANGASGAFAGPGIVNSILLAGRFGQNGAAIGGGGFNFANGGAFSAPLRATADSTPLSGVSALTNVATNQQIQNYLTSVGGAANPQALYVVKTGDNDLQFVRAMGTTWIAANPGFLPELAVGQALNVAALQAAGARTILVPNSYNYAVFASEGGYIPEANAELYARSQSYSMMRWTSLTAAGVRFIPADIDSLYRFVVQNPVLFGFTPSSVLSANAVGSAQSPLYDSWNDVTPAQLETSLFIGANGVHFTTAGQQIESDYEYSLLSAPSQISLLAECAVQDGLARFATIQGQIDLTGQHRGPSGLNVWASGGLNALNFKNTPGFPDASGTPLTGSLGADYQLPGGVIVGAAVTLGHQTQKFASDGGDFEQTGEALSLYTAGRYGPVWGNVTASYGLYQDSVSRQAVLGKFMDQNSAHTTGQSLGLALRAGGDLVLGPVTTGPVAGLIVQQVRIKGFTESGTSGVTALSFGGQTRDSAVSQLGWRVLVDVDRWQPFAEAKWNHELVGQDRLVKAALTTTSAQHYSLAAAPTATDWTTASLGTSFKLSDRVLLRGAASASIDNPQVVTYGGELGISVSF